MVCTTENLSNNSDERGGFILGSELTDTSSGTYL